MATEWSHVVELLSTISHGSPHEAVPELCKIINNGSSNILSSEDEFEEFFSSLVALSAHFIGLNISSCTDCLHHATGACKVLLKFCLSRIKKERDKLFSKKNLVSVIEGLCKGHGCLDRTEVATFMAVIKLAKYPKSEETSITSDETTKSEFYGRLTRQGLLNTSQGFARLPFARHRMFGFEDDEMIDVKTHISNANVSTLREMQGGQVLLDLCASLPNISQFMTLRGMNDSKPSMKTIDNLSLASMLSFSINRAQELSCEINLICSIASLPVMEPLNSCRLNKIMLLGLGCVDVAIYAASGYLTSTDIEDVDEMAKQLVDTSLSIVDMISHTLSTSHRAGGHIVQNFNLLITHCILKGLMPLMKAREVNEDRIGETRWEGFNVLRVELSKKVIGILSSLLEDLKLETGNEDSDVIIPADEMNIEVHVSAWGRIKLLFDHLDFVPLLMKILIRSYYKADFLSEKLLTSEKSEDQSKSTNNDAETKSNNSNEDSSEGETLFGGLFESQGAEHETPAAEDPKILKSEDKFVLAESYLEMSKTMLVFISDYMLNNISPSLVSSIQQTLPMTHLTDLAYLVHELDGAKTHIGNLSTSFTFNQCLDRYLHILLTFGVLTDEQQEAFLKQLGISPHASEHWPLYIGPRSLSILARVLLGRQERCRAEDRDDESCVKIWTRLIQTLREMSLNERRRPDLNVEQLQLMLLLWHNFTKKQRDKIIVLCINALYDISQDSNLSDKVPMYGLRLLTILDYMLFQYNEPPRELLTQVQYNLFKTKLSYMAMLHMDDDLMDEPRLLFFPTVEREDRDYHRPTGDPLGHTYEKRTPRFYGVRCGDQNELPDEMFKHLLSILDKEPNSYGHLHTSLITLLSAGSKCDVLKRKKVKFVNLSDAKIVRCIFGMCWRLLVSLPPPVAFLRLLQQYQVRDIDLKSVRDFVTVLVSFYWTTKLSNSDDPSSIKNALVEQKISTEDALPMTIGFFTAACDDVKTVKHAANYLQQILDHFTHRDEVLSPDQLPGLLTLITVDCIMTRVSVVLKAKPAMTESLTLELEKLFVVLLKFVKVYQGFARFCLLSHHNVLSKGIRDQDIAIYSKVIKISSSAMAKNPILASAVITGLPIPVEEVKQWNSLGSVDFNPLFSPEDIINESISDPTQMIYTLLSSHMKVMSFRFPFNLDASIRHVMKSLVQLTASLLTECPKEEGSLHSVFMKEITDAVIPLVVDASAEYLFEETENILENVFGSLENEECANQIQNYLLENCYDLMIEHSLSRQPVLCEDIFVDCERFMESLLERPQGRNTLKIFFEESDKFVRLLLLSANQNFSLSFVHRMLKFLSRTFETYEKQPSDPTALTLVQSISQLSEVDSSLLTTWLNRIIVGSVTDKEMTGKMADNRLLLQSIVTFLVKEQSPVGSAAINTLLDSIIPLGTLLLDMATDVSVVIGSKFVDFLSISSTLAGFGDGSGHLKLMKAVVTWLQICKSDLNPNLIRDSKAKDNTNSLVECTNVLLAHVADVLVVLKQTSDDDDMCSGCHGDDNLVSDVESDGGDDDDDSGAEESEEDAEGNQMWNKLCTFTATRKEFANQHWYHCHTCRMNDGVGVCTICAKVCHKNHDVTYAKYGSFFCDCGAKEDDSCKAMKKRNPHDISDMASPDEKISAVSSYRRPMPLRAERGSSSTEAKPEELDKKEKSSYEFGQPVFRRDLRKQVEPNKKALINVITDNDMCQTLITLLNALSRVSHHGNTVVGGARQRITQALEDLHSSEKAVENNEQLLVPTSGSQEGAFENVKMVSSGEQGQAIRQLMGTHVLRRVAMCCLTSAKGRRQHLAVNHEKGKITILQLSSLLKQADSSRRKLTITRLATTQVPFTILSLTGNICNEDFLAVCGLKDCHVLTLGSNGSVLNHLVLHPQLETGNFIIKTIWLPGSQTELAIVTADFVQIYDLSKDALSPVFYFVLPAGKVRDVTFIFQSSLRVMCLMSSEGQIYTQQLDESSSAKSGSFYLTNIVPVVHPDLKDNNGQVSGGGVSVYYSHGLQMLFFSYVQGKTFVAPWTENLARITKLFEINVKPANGNKDTPATLCQWSEVLQHPGLVLCLIHTTGIPIVLMVKPDNIFYQEIKSASSKSKIQDVVAIRHSLSNTDQSRTTVILLCEDGSLKIYMANQEQAGFWMAPAFQPTSAVAALKPIKPRKSKKNVRVKNSSSPHFPVDFFEHCQALNDVEFGGKDILQVYNVQQVKHRLMTAGMYLACTKPNSFSMTVTNCNPAVVMVGVRILVGCQAMDKAPTFLEVFGRVVDVEIKRNRWFDIPFTREEVLSTDRTITLTFGQSHDASNITMVDSIKVYCKSKEAFGWPDDLQDEGVPPPTPTPTTVPPVSPFTQNAEVLTNTAPLSLREIMTANSLRALDGFVSLVTANEENSYQEIVTVATSLLSSPLPQQVQEQAKILLASLHPTKITYNNHKDHAQLTYVIDSLYKEKSPAQGGAEIDSEMFERLVVMTRAVAVNRPENLVKFANDLTENLVKSETPDSTGMPLPFPIQIISTFWKFYETQPSNSSLVTAARADMHYMEMIIFALVEILHAFIVTDSSYVSMVTELYIQLLLCQDTRVSFACKQALTFVLRPTSRRTPGKTDEGRNVQNKPEEASQTKTDDQIDGTRQSVAAGSSIEDHSADAEDYSVEPGDHSVEPGDNSVEPGGHAVESGDHSGESGDHSGESGDHSVEPGDHSTEAGDHSAEAGGHSAELGDHSAELGDHSTEAGGHSAEPGDHSDEAGDHFVAPGDHFVAPGDHSGEPGDHSGEPGDHNDEAGDHSVEPDLHSAQAGDHFAEPGDHYGEHGDQFAEAGNYPAEAGDNSVEPEDHFADAGDYSAEPGDYSAEAGDRSGEAGDQFAEAGDHSAEAGDHSTEAGDHSGEPGELRFQQEVDVPVPDLPEPGPSGRRRGPASAASSRLQALLNGFPAVYELPPDADDEAMMELAIALSLQEQGEEAALGLHHFLGEAIQNGGPVDEGEQSSSSASGHASEDEMEPATGSMDLVQLQAEAAAQQSALSQGDLGSVSEGSAESLSGENPGDEQDRQEDAMESGVGATPKPDEQTDRFNKYDEDIRQKLRVINMIILRTFIDHFHRIDGISGVQAIPFMQVLLMLCFDLDNNEAESSELLQKVFTKCLEELHLDSDEISDIGTRTSAREVQLIIMRFLSVLMSRSKYSGKSSSPQASSMSTQVATSLFRNNIMEHCLAILNQLMDHWQQREKHLDSEGNIVTLLKPQPGHSPPDMSPFFLKQYVKGHANDIFEAYPLLVTEMVLRLTYQVKKIADGASDVEMKDLHDDWFTCLFEYMMIQQASFVKIKRQVRKLLLFLCGSKENYREQRDSHALDVHFRAVSRICHESGYSDEEQTPINIEYDTLLDLIEHLKAAADIAANRTKNWQAYCLKNQCTLSFLLKVSFIINEGVTATILQLLTTAMCEGDTQKESENPGSVFQLLVQQLTHSVDMNAVRKFVRCFLLQSNSTSIRWQAHSLLHSVHRNSATSEQDDLSDMMWSVWPELPAFGRKAAQFVDLLGYFTIKRSLSEEKTGEFSEKAMALLKKQNEILRNHANSNVYRLLSGLVDFDGFYLESDPCLVCNNPEVPYSVNKLSAIKADARFSTTCHMVKLVGSHNISKVTLRVSDVKRQKMVKTINLYYNNRSVQSVVELKNKSALWQKAKKCHLIQGQTDVKIEFPLPIVACNLMIEYADFYENIQASTETLQCPRCSAAVPANPGVCGNCGENVYQCHKCRSINYDEKDPFLCNACGFCKYAKFDLTLTAKPCCAVDPIENEDDRKKAVASINTLLDRADKMYRQLVAHRQPLDSLLMRIAEQGDNDFVKNDTSHVSVSAAGSAGHAGSQAVNRSIQAVAQRYCVDCKGNFDELSKITQKVLASRKELIEYDNRVRDRFTSKVSKITSSETISPRPAVKQLSLVSDTQSVPGRCYGCSSAATEHCVTLLKALAMKTSTRDKLIKEGLIVELVNFTLYQGTCSIRNNVRDLLCLLTRNNPEAADQFNTILVERVTKGMAEQSINPSVSSSISRDMQLLTRTVQLEDSCWEQRLRCVTQIFLLSVQHVSPIVVQAVTLPCLKILSQFVKPKPATSKVNASKNVNEIASVKARPAPTTNMKDWIESQPGASYEEWKRRVTVQTGTSEAKPSPREMDDESADIQTTESDDLNEEWLKNVMFSPSCGALRQVSCSIVETVCQIPGRKRKIMDLLTTYLQGVGDAGENATEFFNLYFELMKSSSWKGYLASSGALLTIRDLITKEIEQLTVLEETTLSSDLSQGYSLKRLTELMASFVEDKKIKQDFKGKLVGAVLNGYLSLRRLVVQRTKLVDQSQEILLTLLGELTSGTESETKEFMAICVNTLNRYELDDLRTPVFIFERLCNIIYPEENDTSEFLLMLEKDPQQEDFLQGRMQGNPYKSNDTGMGPLMRDVKNKICTDCDLIALLEDDTGMELLVNSKIISLDLPVKEVYKKIWCPQGEGEPMKVVYRMRGLLGDATEDIVEHLDKNNQKGVDNEIVYKMANVMSECGGLEAILRRLSGLHDLVRGRQLLEVMLKLFGFCVKVKANREYLARPSLRTLNILLDVLNQILHVDQATPNGVGTMAEQILAIIEALLQGGGSNMKLMVAGGQEEEESQLEMLLEIIKTPYVRSNNNVLLSLMHILPFLTFGDKKSMNALIDHFEPYLNFEKFDKTHSDDELLFLECFCNIADGIENDENGNQLKNIIIDKGLVQQAVQYLEVYTPSKSFSTSNLSDTDLWKEFLARPSLPFILKFLSGMCKGHERSQLAVSETAVPVIHRLEQVSSEEKVGSLAENLMEALKEHPEAKTKVTAVRRETRLEKKKLAMAMRQKQLGALGMSATESGKIITKPSAVIQGFEEISNETGLTCCICREGYKYHPNKVLGIYTYTKRCILDTFELKQRKTQGYSTVSHFNIVHYECHVAAIRLARGRDEWESAALQNSNTKCNGLLPIWGPQVPESSFASCLARHNNYIQEATSHIEPTFHNTVHDLRLLLERFGYEKTFNEDSGGGGRQSNFNIIPYMVHMALYVMNTARISNRAVTTFVEEPRATWISSSFEVNGPLFMTVLSLFTHSLEEWKKARITFLSRLIVLAHVRHVTPKGATKLSDVAMKSYNVYRPILMFFALVNQLHHMLKEHIVSTVPSTASWSQEVAAFIRNNDEKILKSCEELVGFYQNDLLPASSVTEFFDVAGLLGEIGDPGKFMEDLLNSLPK